MKFAEMENLHFGGAGFFPGRFQMPLDCPHCHTSVYSEPKGISEFPINVDDRVLFVSMQCPVCNKRYVVVFQSNNRRERLDFVQMIPVEEERMDYPGLFRLSPRFKKYHEQALTAYNMGFTELAVLGFRSALEFLIKDFAIDEESADEKKTAEMTFNDVVLAYLGHLKKSTDVVRALGNDYTHYREKHPDIPASSAFQYYRIVLNEMENRYAMNHTPLSE